ncbi:dihydrolipoyllysine-residue acetyltransferase component of acetoin cleaving system-like protein, partial [Trifolium pratense]
MTMTFASTTTTSLTLSHRRTPFSYPKSRFPQQNSVVAFSTFSNNQIVSELTIQNEQVQTRMWNWKGYFIRYQYSGNNGPALVLVHGFGAN